MNILLVDNNTKHTEEIKSALNGHTLQVHKYKPGLEFNVQDIELVVLSGGSGWEANQAMPSGGLWYQDEINFIAQTELPVVGLCMGFELLAVAYGEELTRLSAEVRGMKNINFSVALPEGWPTPVSQFEAHQWGVKQLISGNFKELANSEFGVEAIKHLNKPVIGVQFHPEVSGGSVAPADWLNWLIGEVSKS